MLSLGLVVNYAIGVQMYMRSIIGTLSITMMIEGDTIGIRMLKKIDGHSDKIK